MKDPIHKTQKNMSTQDIGKKIKDMVKEHLNVDNIQ